jgi:hypothetical protein
MPSLVMAFAPGTPEGFFAQSPVFEAGLFTLYEKS